MELKLSKKESEEYFYNALCNGLDWLCGMNDLSIHYSKAHYKQAREKLAQKLQDGHGEGQWAICFEDVLMQILRDGNPLTIIDLEASVEGEKPSGYTRTIRIKHVHKRVGKTQLNHLLDMVNQQDDAITADVILQQVFFKEIIFG
tara:strand:- start:487 stop:921 length:435 start_codon:yes stop_codon:yes gene_type:complete